MALAGVTACTVQPTELIVPYVRQPEEEIPGKPLFFATAMSLGGVATGLLVESHEGRPTKVEGNPDHPASHGATDLFAQASVLTLYDPDRSQTITQLGEIRPWNTFVAAARAGLSAQSATKGAGLRILTETVNSPSLAAQIQQVLTLQPNAKWIQWEPMPRDNARAGARLAFGEYLEAIYDLTKADVILSLDADFLASEGPQNLHYSRAVRVAPDGRRRPGQPQSPVRGRGESLGDGRHARTIACRSSRARLKRSPGPLPRSWASPACPAPRRPASQAYVDAVATDLAAHQGRSAGDRGRCAAGRGARARARDQRRARQPGATVTLPADTRGRAHRTARGSSRAGRTTSTRGRVQMLVIIGESNPVLSAPADFEFAEAMRKVALRVHSGLFFDETAAQCHWHVPAAHYLEAWSDARTFDGTVSIVQPLIQPLYGGKSVHEIIATLSDRPERNGYDIVREYWSANTKIVVPQPRRRSPRKPTAYASRL